MRVFRSSFHPSVCPSSRPPVLPPFRPSVLPSFRPSVFPSFRPSFRPSVLPSFLPSFRPFIRPSVRPFVLPYVRPSVRPSFGKLIVEQILPSLSVTPCAPLSGTGKRVLRGAQRKNKLRGFDKIHQQWRYDRDVARPRERTHLLAGDDGTPEHVQSERNASG